MAKANEVTVYFSGDTKGFDQAVGKVSKSGSGLKKAIVGIGAGIGIASVGKKLLTVTENFQDAALSANDFATASGLTVQDASRLQEVARDLGLDTGTLQGALGRLSKGLGKDAGKWKQYGVTVAKTASGQVDAKQTFLNGVDALHKISDPLLRAKVASELFGKSWQDLAPLIEVGAAGISQRMNEVSSGQVFTPEKVAQAKLFRDSLDQLSDAFTALQLNIGVKLAPILAGFFAWLAQLNPTMVTAGVAILGGVFIFGKLASAISGVGGALTMLATNPWAVALLAAIAVIILLVKNWDSVTAAVQRATAAVQGFIEKISGPLQGPIKFIDHLFGGSLGNAKGTTSLGPAGVAYAKSKGIPGYATGGWVGGAMGAPQLAIVHGGEYVMSSGEARRGGGVTITGNTFVVQSPDDGYRIGRALDREATRKARARG